MAKEVDTLPFEGKVLDPVRKPVTVAKLIEELLKYPPDMIVVTIDNTYGENWTIEMWTDKVEEYQTRQYGTKKADLTLGDEYLVID
jgi:hypothetical protein